MSDEEPVAPPAEEAPAPAEAAPEAAEAEAAPTEAEAAPAEEAAADPAPAEGDAAPPTEAGEGGGGEEPAAEPAAEAAAEEPPAADAEPAAEGGAAAEGEPAAEPAPEGEGASAEEPAPESADAAGQTDAAPDAGEEPELPPAEEGEAAAARSTPDEEPPPAREGGDVAHAAFVILPENFQHSTDVPVNMEARDVITSLSKELNLPAETMMIKFKGNVLAPTDTLASVGINPGETELLELVVDYPEDQANKNKRAPELLDTIDVEVDQGAGNPPRIVQVQVDKASLDKMPFRGGYRNKKTGVQYLHASTMTDRKPKYSEKDRKWSRDTQTYEMRTRSLMTTREAHTQMVRLDLMLDDSGDVEVEPGPYMTADEFLRLKIQKTIVIQRFTRGWFARRLAAGLRLKREERRRFLAEEEVKRQRDAEERRRREIERRMRPRTAADFEILYNELEAWRLQETEKIKSAGLSPEEEQGALRQLLHKETKLLQTIDRLKISANHENRDRRIASTLTDMSKPKRWEMSDGGTVEVHTPFTTRAKELMQLYNGLRLPLLTTDERLDVLLHVKWTVKEFDCNLTREIVELIDREADLLNRGRSANSMDGLRKRIANLFLQFIETPEFNPEASRYQIVPIDFDTKTEGVQAIMA